MTAHLRHAMTRAVERLDAASRLRGRYNAQDHALDLCEQARAILDGALRDARADDITQRVELPKDERPEASQTRGARMDHHGPGKR